MVKAVELEIKKKYIEAVACYEKNISKELAIPDDYINLSFLYWSFAFELFEFNKPNSINDEMSLIGGNKYMKVLDLGLNKFPNNLEIHFWKKYFQHISFGVKFTE
ncbi:MAG: hypothetical protein RLZZ500_37, partial [Bacteroidota bacterium]